MHSVCMAGPASNSVFSEGHDDVKSAAWRAAAERMWSCAGEFDAAGADLAALLDPLAEVGLFKAVLPRPYGNGLATDPGRTKALLDILRTVGSANLSAGRLLEGHVNAVKLVDAFGDEGPRRDFFNDIAAGALSGVWNAEAPPGLRIQHGEHGPELCGGKIHASGAGTLKRPLVTARGSDGSVQLIALKHPDRIKVDLSVWRVRGMRGTATGTIDLTGYCVQPAELIGGADCYYAAPGFKGGAWRFAAVQLGGIERIVVLMRDGLNKRGRSTDPHHRARLGRAAIAAETARLWVERAAERVETALVKPQLAEAYATMARLSVERAAVEVIALAEKALGLSSMMQAEPIERVVRDLTTYIRQPFADAVLDEVAGFILAQTSQASPIP